MAESIGPRLARAAVAARVDGEVVDLCRPLEADATLEILTERDPAALDVLRHSAAHVLATAVRRVRPDAKIGFGPAIEDGFYYDFEVDEPFTPEELERDRGRDDAGGRRGAALRAAGGRTGRRRGSSSPTTRSSWSAWRSSATTR